MVWQRVEPPLCPGVNEVRSQRVSLYEGYGYCLVHGISQDVMQVNSHRPSVVQAGFPDQEARPSYQLASGSLRALQGNDRPDYDLSQISMRANSQDHVTELNTPSYPSPIGGAAEVCSP